MRTLLSNFGYSTLNPKQIEDHLKTKFGPKKESFALYEVIEIVTNNWFFDKGRERESEEIFKLFDRRNKDNVSF